MFRMSLFAVLCSLVAVTTLPARSAHGEPRQPGDEAAAQCEPNSVNRDALEQLPIKEITVFKDGHAFVLQQGTATVDAKNRVHLDRLPRPVIGTLWPYVAGDKARLVSVVAESRRVRATRPALNVRELLEVNPGAKVRIKQATDSFTATVVSIPAAEAEPTDDAEPSPSGERHQGEVIILQTEEGHRVVPLASIREVTFLDPPKSTVGMEKKQNVLAMQLEWPAGKRQPQVAVGMVYLQKGIRWIPSYRIDLDGQGKAHVRLQATLINELGDLDNVTANLVIGVPKFTFEDTLDPMALSQAAAELSPYFQQPAQTALAFSNAIQTQVARMGEHRRPRPQPRTDARPNLGPDIAAGNVNEDLYIFTLSGISLRKGARMVVPVTEFELPYEDVYTVRLGMAPPPEVVRHFNNSQQAELAKLMYRTKAMHQARLTNRSDGPLTTAPAMIMRDGQLVGQGMMTYTPVGGQVDVEITAAVDIAVSKDNVESKRTPNAATIGSHAYDRVDLAGTIRLHNYRGERTRIEVVRHVLGNVDKVDSDGEVKQLNVREEGWQLVGGLPPWWHWYSWPYGWFHLNTISEISWQCELDAGEAYTMSYRWHYFWRR